MTVAPTPLIDRLMAKITENADGCWIFNGARSAGYGVLGRAGRGTGLAYAHRTTYEFFIAEIPDGLHIDHLCRVRECCNPWHLEPVSQQENNVRSKRDNPKTHCTHGHEFTPENTGQGKYQRYCRTCKNAYNRARRQGEKAS
jgi:HNH endonuclease